MQQEPGGDELSWYIQFEYDATTVLIGKSSIVQVKFHLQPQTTH